MLASNRPVSAANAYACLHGNKYCEDISGKHILHLNRTCSDNVHREHFTRFGSEQSIGSNSLLITSRVVFLTVVGDTPLFREPIMAVWAVKMALVGLSLIHI